MVYFDDILIYNANRDEHMHHLNAVLQILHHDKFYAGAQKCIFFTTSVQFLGYVISYKGL